MAWYALTAAGCLSGPRASAEPAQPTLRELWVKHHLVPCDGWQGQNYCYAVSERRDGPWSLARHGLQNFYYQWGYSYRLLVAPSDEGEASSDPDLRVVKIAKKTPVQIGTEFDFAVEPKGRRGSARDLLSLSKRGGQILNGPAFTCSTRTICSDLERRLANDDPFVVTFKYGYGGIYAERVSGPDVAETTVEVEGPSVSDQ